MDEQQLIEGIKIMDNNTITHLYENHFDKISRYLVGKGCDYDLSKDIFQDSIVALVTNIQANKFKGESLISSYLTSIAKFKWFAIAKSKDNTETDSIDDVNEFKMHHIDFDAENDEIDIIIQKNLKGLSEQCMSLLYGNIFLEKSLNEMAIELGLTYDFVRQKKRRCLNEIKALLLKEELIVEKYG